jgi:hypothetical protein
MPDFSAESISSPSPQARCVRIGAPTIAQYEGLDAHWCLLVVDSDVYHLYIINRQINRQSSGRIVRLAFPTSTVAAYRLHIIVTSLAANVWSAWPAAKVRLTESLRME